MKFIDLNRQYEAYRTEIDSAVMAVLESGQFILGPAVAQLEEGLAAYVGAAHAIGVSSGTDGLLLALMAYDIAPGDEVITTPFTFMATAEVILLLKAKPVFVDIDPQTFNLDVARTADVLKARRGAGGRVRGILPVSLYGQCPDLAELNALAGKEGLFVIEDACQSFGALYQGKRSCSVTDCAVTSFFPSKPLGCYGDGGMVFTCSAELAEKVRRLRVHGQGARYSHVEVGLNGRLDTLQAAIVLAKFPHFEEELRQRRRIAETYGRLLRGRTSGLVPPIVRDDRTSVYAQYTVRIPGGRRDEVARALAARGIPTAVHYPTPLHLQPALATLGYGEASLPEAERAAREVLSLPIHPFLSEDEQEAVVDALGAAL